MTPAQEYLKAIGWQGTEEDFYRSKGLLPAAPAPKPFDYMGYFDPAYYSQQNPDVAAAGVDPLRHYEEFGWHEGRNPSARFDTSDYLDQYADVKNANINPLQHYVQYGIGEYRNPFMPTPQAPQQPSTPTTPTTPTTPIPPNTPPRIPTRDELGAEARGGVKGYFMGKGVDPNKYDQQIADRIAMTLAGIPDANLGGSGLFTGVGEGLYNELSEGYRNQARSAFDQANRSYSNPWGTTFDDDLIKTILGEQRSGAESLIDTALARGLANESGASQARAELDRQQAAGSDRLNTLGSTFINQGNTDFGSRQASRRNALGNIGLDQAYDAAAPDMGTLSNEFMLSLGRDLRGSTRGPGVIFNTSNLPGLGSINSSQLFSNNTPFASINAGSPTGRTPGGAYQPKEEDNILF